MKMQYKRAVTQDYFIIPWRIMTICLALILISACASKQPSSNLPIIAAEQAIESAERARVSEYAAAELVQARDILNRAELAAAQKDHLSASRLAEQSQVTAQLAVSRAELQKAEKINAEMKQSLIQLKQEIQRNKDGNL